MLLLLKIATFVCTFCMLTSLVLSDALWDKLPNSHAPGTGGNTQRGIGSFWSKMVNGKMAEEKIPATRNSQATMQNRRSDSDNFSNSRKPQQTSSSSTVLQRLAQLLKKKKKPHGDIHFASLHKSTIAGCRKSNSFNNFLCKTVNFH